MNMKPRAHNPNPLAQADGWDVSAEEKQQIQFLMERISNGDKAATNLFMKAINQWSRSHATNIAATVLGDAMDDARTKDGLQEVLEAMIVDPQAHIHHFNNQPQMWDRFAISFKVELIRKYESMLQDMRTDEDNYNRLKVAVTDEPPRTANGSSGRIAPEYVRAANQLLKLDTPTPDEAYETHRRVGLLNNAIGELTPRDQHLVLARAEGVSLSEVAQELCEKGLTQRLLTPQTISQLDVRLKETIRKGAPAPQVLADRSHAGRVSRGRLRARNEDNFEF